MRYATKILTLALGLAFAQAVTCHAIVFYVDDFSDGTVGISSPAGALATDTSAGLSGVVGGERYSYVQRTSPAGVVSLGVNTFPFVGFTFYTSTSTAKGIGGLSYGHTTPLGLDLSDPVYTGFFLKDFSADEPGSGGTIRLTLYSGATSASVAYNIGDFMNTLRWNLEDFSDVDLSSIDRIDLDWYGFGENGADIEFTGFGISNSLPEPTTTVLMAVGFAILQSIRRRRRS